MQIRSSHTHTHTQRKGEKLKGIEPGEDTFDRQVYKEYTQMGTKVKFLVWPALFLYEGGALISKGLWCLEPL
jgi:hypothetical protein